jgi:hypothetical protein
MERRFLHVRKKRNETFRPIAGTSPSHAQEGQMRRTVKLSLALVLVLMLHFASPRTRAQSVSKASAPAPGATSPSGETPTLDYEFFKTRVEPIFLKKRPTHARCYVCHEEANHALKLAKLSPGNTTWTEGESRHNFDTVSQLVTPGDPLGSILLHHPLAPEAGGDAFHSGGRQFESQNDADWQTLADWVRGRKTN